MKEMDFGLRIEERRVSRLAGLTPRQLLCVKLVADGWQIKKIADLMKLSIKTVSGHLVYARKRIQCGPSVAELTKWAVREGVTPL